MKLTEFDKLNLKMSIITTIQLLDCTLSFKELDLLNYTQLEVLRDKKIIEYNKNLKK